MNKLEVEGAEPFPSFSKFNQSRVTLARPIRSQYVLTNGKAHQ